MANNRWIQQGSATTPSGAQYGDDVILKDGSFAVINSSNVPIWFATQEESLVYKGQLTSASNLDNYFGELGIYQVAGAQGTPSADAYGILLVCKASGYSMQLYFSRVQNRAYFRTQENGQAITPWFTLFTAGSNGTGSDFNNIAKSGSYGIFGSGTAMHAPYEGAYGTLQVYQANQYITQTFINVVNATTYVRAYNGSVWTAWKTL